MNIRKRTNSVQGFAALVLGLSMLVGCSKVDLSPAVSGNGQIGFTPVLSGNTKASFFDSNNLKSIGLIAYYTGSADFAWTHAGPNFMKNLHLQKAGSIWIYSPLKYWPSNATEKISFFAYAPHSASFNATDGAVYLDSTATVPALFVRIPSDQTKQADVMVSNAKLNTKISDAASGIVNLAFNHVLSSINFTAKTSSGTATITSLKIYYTSNVKRSGKVSLQDRTWLSGSLADSYTAFDGSSAAKKNEILKNAVSVSTSASTLSGDSAKVFIIPQNLAAGDIKLDIAYTNAGTSYNKTISLPASTYSAGMNYTYQLSLSIGEVYPIPVPTVPSGTVQMNPNYTSNNSSPNTNYTLPQGANYTTGIQFKSKQDYYVYGNLKVTNWWTNGGNLGTLYVMPGGTLDLTSLSGLGSGMKIVNYGSVLFPSSFAINQGASFTSIVSIDASSTSMNIGGTIETYGCTQIGSINAWGTGKITMNGCLITSSIVMTNTNALYIGSYLSTNSLDLGSSSTLELAGGSLAVVNGNFTIGYSSSKIFNSDNTYAVFKCNTLNVEVSDLRTRATGKIDIHATLNNTAWPPTLQWNSSVILNGSTTITAEGCRPAFP